jgi:MFS family permease
MIGVTMATFGIGRLISKTGRYKPFPIIGAALSAGGLVVMAQIDGATKYGALIIPMIVMGFGSASIFSSTSVASQNGVEFHDLGVATATVMFFRSLGGSLGLAIFGTILNSTIRSEVPNRTGIAADKVATLIREPQHIKTLPTVQREAIVDGIALGVSRIYWCCVAVMIVGFLVALVLPEVQLKKRAGLSDALESSSH